MSSITRFSLILGSLFIFLGCSDSKSNKSEPSPFEGQWIEASTLDLYYKTNDSKALCSLGVGGQYRGAFEIEGLKIDSTGKKQLGNFNLNSGEFKSSGYSPNRIQNDGRVPLGPICTSCDPEVTYIIQYTFLDESKNKLKEQLLDPNSEEQNIHPTIFNRASNEEILKLSKLVENCKPGDADGTLKKGDTVNLDEDITEEFLNTLDGTFKADFLYDGKRFNEEFLKIESGNFIKPDDMAYFSFEEKDMSKYLNDTGSFSGKSMNAFCRGEITWEITTANKRKYVDVPVILNGSKRYSSTSNENYLILKGISISIDSVEVYYYAEDYTKVLAEESQIKIEEVKDQCHSNILSTIKTWPFHTFSEGSIFIEAYELPGSSVVIDEKKYEKLK